MEIKIAKIKSVAPERNRLALLVKSGIAAVFISGHIYEVIAYLKALGHLDIHTSGKLGGVGKGTADSRCRRTFGGYEIHLGVLRAAPAEEIAVEGSEADSRRSWRESHTYTWAAGTFKYSRTRIDKICKCAAFGKHGVDLL